MKKKQQFLQAVHILAPGDLFILQAAERVREETLPPIPGGAALEFVAAMERLRQHQPQPARARRQSPSPAAAPPPQAWLAILGDAGAALRPVSSPRRLSLAPAVRVRSAEYWLKLGQPESALLELERLPRGAQRHPWARQVRAAACEAARAREQLTLQE